MCIIGPSGSGKSTLLRCINHLEKINAGRLWVDGELVGYREHGGKLYELRDKEICAKRAEIGMVFQQFNLFPHMTALENVIEAPVRVKRLTRARAAELAARAAGPGRPAGQGGRLPQAAVRRPAAAGRHRPGAGHAAQADAVRRADQRAGPRAGRRGAGRHARPGRVRDDDGRRHPRDGLRPRGRRQPGVHGRRRHRRGRPPGRSWPIPSTTGPGRSWPRSCNGHLGRSAVSCRLRRSTALPGVDLDDPDERLALHLACRARLLGRAGPG